MSTTLKGRVASKGHAMGKVVFANRILPKDTQIEKGNILIAEMTDPDLLHAMSKAGAIVTQNGGLLCHAAIVARELGIPCIVGVAGLMEGAKGCTEAIVDAYTGNVVLK